MNTTNGAEGLYAQLAELRARIEALEDAARKHPGPFADKMGAGEPLPSIFKHKWKEQLLQPFEPGESAVPALVKFVEGEK